MVVIEESQEESRHEAEEQVGEVHAHKNEQLLVSEQERKNREPEPLEEQQPAEEAESDGRREIEETSVDRNREFAPCLDYSKMTRLFDLPIYTAQDPEKLDEQQLLREIRAQVNTFVEGFRAVRAHRNDYGTLLGLLEHPK